MQSEFERLINHHRQDVTKIENPNAKELFETSAEVLKGLSKAFDGYAQKKEEAWKQG